MSISFNGVTLECMAEPYPALTWGKCVSGYPDQALARSNEAFAIAQKNPVGLAHFRAGCYRNRRGDGGKRRSQHRTKDRADGDRTQYQAGATTEVLP